jgi:hypothetical protein
LKPTTLNIIGQQIAVETIVVMYALFLTVSEHDTIFLQIFISILVNKYKPGMEICIPVRITTGISMLENTAMIKKKLYVQHSTRMAYDNTIIIALRYYTCFKMRTKDFKSLRERGFSCS